LFVYIWHLTLSGSGSSEFFGTGSEIRATQCNDLTVQDVIQEGSYD